MPRHHSRSRSASPVSPHSPQSSRLLALRPDRMPAVESLMIQDYLHSFREENAVRTDLMDCKIYFSGLPEGTKETDFMDVLIKAMIGLRLVVKTGDPVTKVEMGHDGTYVFVDFRSVEEANSALTLHGMSYKGRELKVSRPKNYTGSQPLSSQSLNCIFGSYAVKNMRKRPLEEFLQGAVQPPRRVELLSSVIVLLRAVVNLRELTSDSEYQELWTDMEEELKTHGDLISMKIPRKGQLGVGNVYARYANKDQAKYARKVLSSKRFAGKFLVIKYHPEVMYEQDDFREGWQLQAITYEEDSKRAE